MNPQVIFDNSEAQAGWQRIAQMTALGDSMAKIMLRRQQMEQERAMFGERLNQAEQFHVEQEQLQRDKMKEAMARFQMDFDAQQAKEMKDQEKEMARLADGKLLGNIMAQTARTSREKIVAAWLMKTGNLKDARNVDALAGGEGDLSSKDRASLALRREDLALRRQHETRMENNYRNKATQAQLTNQAEQELATLRASGASSRDYAQALQKYRGQLDSAVYARLEKAQTAATKRSAVTAALNVARATKGKKTPGQQVPALLEGIEKASSSAAKIVWERALTKALGSVKDAESAGDAIRSILRLAIGSDTGTPIKSDRDLELALQDRYRKNIVKAAQQYNDKSNALELVTRAVKRDLEADLFAKDMPALLKGVQSGGRPFWEHAKGWDTQAKDAALYKLAQSIINVTRRD